MNPITVAPPSLSLLDFRRRTRDLYADVRDQSRQGDVAGAHRLWASARADLLATHPQSPLRPEHRSAPVVTAEYDPAYRFEVAVESSAGSAGPDHLDVPTGTDGVVPFDRVGAVRLSLPIGEVRLDLWWLGSYGGGLFLPFRETDPGPDGYGGGRYLLDTVKGADLGGTVGSADDHHPATVVVDLNFAYHPSCAYDPAWACPLAPPGDVVTGRVPVGERYVGPWAAN